jgi:hypothetical protein
VVVVEQDEDQDGNAEAYEEASHDRAELWAFHDKLKAVAGSLRQQASDYAQP